MTQAPSDDVVVAVRCSRCSRFWFNLTGSPDGVLRRVDGYAETEFEISDDGQVHSRFPPNASLVRVTPHAGPDRDEEPMVIYGTEFLRKQYVRYRVLCHPRCGADSRRGWRTQRTYRVRTLAEKFAEAVKAGHRDTRL